MKTCRNQTATPFLRGVATVCALLLCTTLLFGQDRVVSGTVKDEAGNVLPGATVQIKSSLLGAVTDGEGNYRVNVGAGADVVLLFSFLGYATVEIDVGQQTVIDVHLIPNLTELQEIVVTGYSTISKKDLASSISVVDVDDMKKIASPNFAEQLQGKVAGVQISTSGDPASLQYVRVRGIGTINNNEPLYVIDGVPVQNETNMNFLNPNDIETLQVLKDAAAASIYGARAANGVIVITTKRGTGRSKFNFDFFTGIQDPQNFPEMANPSEMLEIQKGLYEKNFNSTFYLMNPVDSVWSLPDFLVTTRGYLAGDTAIDLSKYVLNTSDPDLYSKNFPIAAANKEGTNWFEELFKPASMTSVQLSASGGNEKGSHYFSLNYFDYNGILIGNEWQRVQTRLNSTFSTGKNFRLGENLNISFQTGKGFDGLRGSLFNVMSAYSYLPIVPLHDINGYWTAAGQSGTVGQNPVAGQTRNADGSDSHSLRLTGNVFAEADFLKYFTFRVNAGLDYFQQPLKSYLYTCPECGLAGNSNGLEKKWLNSRSWVLTSTLNFNRSIGNHMVYGLAGAEARETYNEGFSAMGRGLAFGDDPYYRELGNVQSNTQSIGSNSSNSRMASAFVNANYTYREKYIIAATLRRDGSSKFINNKYGMFPGMSAAWRVSREPFLNSFKFIDDLKVRASYGVTGNNEVVGGDYPGYSSYGLSLGSSSYPINGSVNNVTQGFALASSGNRDLKWETCRLTNLALDATFRNKMDLTLEWYNRKTKDMILGVAPPLETGNYYRVNQNIGSMVNKGVELQVSYKGEGPSKKFSYNIGLTGTYFTNKVLSLADSISFVNGVSLHAAYPAISRTQVGYPISQFYGYMAEGLWQSDEEIKQVLFADPLGVSSGAKPGRMKFRDVNGDGAITDADRTFIGNPIPKFILGLNVTLNYNNFDVTAYFSGVLGNKIFNAIKSNTDFSSTTVLLSGPGNKSKRMLYGAGKDLPLLDVNDTYSGRTSSYFVEDGSFFQGKNIVLGYALPDETVSKAGLVRARIYFQAQNLFTLTRYSGLDPDVTVFDKLYGNQPGRDMTTGVDVGRYPRSRQFIIGVNIEF